jgi:hypothetical protein
MDYYIGSDRGVDTEVKDLKSVEKHIWQAYEKNACKAVLIVDAKDINASKPMNCADGDLFCVTYSNADSKIMQCPGIVYLVSNNEMMVLMPCFLFLSRLLEKDKRVVAYVVTQKSESMSIWNTLATTYPDRFYNTASLMQAIDVINKKIRRTETAHFYKTRIRCRQNLRLKSSVPEKEVIVCVKATTCTVTLMDGNAGLYLEYKPSTGPTKIYPVTMHPDSSLTCTDPYTDDDALTEALMAYNYGCADPKFCVHFDPEDQKQRQENLSEVYGTRIKPSDANFPGTNVRHKPDRANANKENSLMFKTFTALIGFAKEGLVFETVEDYAMILSSTLDKDYDFYSEFLYSFPTLVWAIKHGSPIEKAIFQILSFDGLNG